LGFVFQFLSHPAIVGFQAGAAVTIGLQQLRGLLNLSNFTIKTDFISVMKSVLSQTNEVMMSSQTFTSGSSVLRMPVVTDSKLGRASVQWNWRSIVIGLAFLIFLIFVKLAVRILNPFISAFPLNRIELCSYPGSVNHIKTIESGFTINKLKFQIW